MLLRPLFYTSFLIDDLLDDDGLAERGPILISSASSKTALAAAFLLAQRDRASRLIGLTSGRTSTSSRASGIYTRCVSYDQIDVARARARVDVRRHRRGRRRPAGRPLALRRRARREHGRRRDALGGAAPGAAGLPGPAPAFFFAPDRVVKRSTDWGRGGLNDRVADAWHPFCEWAGRLAGAGRGRRIRRGRMAAYLAVLEGRVEPRQAHVLALE